MQRKALFITLPSILESQYTTSGLWLLIVKGRDFSFVEMTKKVAMTATPNRLK
jgi:hypothetical protein